MDNPTNNDSGSTTEEPGSDDDEAKTAKAVVRSYSPWRAWDDWRPAKLFNYNECKLAKLWARQRGLAMFALEVSNESRAMNYVVGTWETARDMVVRRELFGPHGTLLAHNPKALGAVYECLFKDQRSLPLFDLEFYADRKHANAHLEDLKVMDRMTRLVARSASALMAELFPDQVELRTGARGALAPHPHSPHDGWPSRVLRVRHYEAPKGLRAPPVRLDPERDWRVLDASMYHKRSQHLILDPDAGLCWDTLVDQALFVGLLMRRVYRAAFALDTKGGGGGDDSSHKKAWSLNAGFRQAAQQLFVSDLHGDTQRIWTTVLDPVVYKSFQLVRTAYSSKRTQERPLLPRAEVFGLGDDAVHCEGDTKAPWSRTALLEHTLVGRVGRGTTVQRLSFARCYPSLFGASSSATPPDDRLVPTCSRQLGAWRWVPNYQGRGQDAPPRLNHTAPGQGKVGPWEISKHRKAVQEWLRRVDPTAAPPAASLLPLRSRASSKPSDATLRAWEGTSEVMDYARGEISTAAECVAHYMAASVDLLPWVRSAGGVDEIALALHIKVSAFKDRRTGRPRYSALVDPGQKYCPIQRTTHEAGRPFLLINAQRGTARVKCLAGKCSQLELRLPMALLPEHLDVIFRSAQRPAARNRKRSRLERQEREKRAAAAKAKDGGAPPKRPRKQ